MTDRARLAAAERELIEMLATAARGGWSEDELREIAATAGIPLDAVREAMQALQRGDWQSPQDEGQRER